MARRLGVIGCGRIALPVLQACVEGSLAGWALGGVLARTSRPAAPGSQASPAGPAGIDWVTSDADLFFSLGLDLIVEAAGPGALAEHGARALAVADVWTVSGAALADPRLCEELEASGRRSGHRLRLLSGAIAGLDGIAMAFADPDATLKLEVDLPAAEGEAGRLFYGTVREAARRYPDGVNVAVAAALAGPGLDRATVEVSRHDSRHRLALAARSRHAQVLVSVEPRADAGLHPVAACILACLRCESQTIWAG
jgi:aspartate dehydrogenase